MPSTITALDIGTHSIKLLVGEIQPHDRKVVILAQARVPCFGVRHAEVVKPERVGQAITEALEHLTKSQVEPNPKVWVTVGGSHLYTVKSQGLISVSRADQTISEEDKERVLQASKAINLPSNKEILDVFPQEFIVDGESGISEPVGLKGVRLEVKTLLLCAFSPVLESLVKAVEEAGLEIEGILPSVLASARACLNAQQKELGVALVDIGAGTTSIAFYEKGRLIDCSVFPVGSANITNDLAIGLRVDIKTAEVLKKKYLDLRSFLKSRKGRKPEKSKKIEITEQNIFFSKNEFDKIVKARIDQIFSELKKKIKETSKHTSLPAGIVFCGGGSLMPHIVEYAKKILELPAFLGKISLGSGSQEDKFLDLSMAASAGLLIVAAEKKEEKDFGIGSSLASRIKRFLKIFIP